MGFYVSKKGVFFSPFSKTAPRILLILCKMVMDNRAHCISQIDFLKKVLIPDYRGFKCPKKTFLNFLSFFAQVTIGHIVLARWIF